ncbi:MAG: exodeoxyribonuclease VII small subunit [Micavibrio sp.]|nr:MAG: exodeoxyribonuclease VII small subunit [Micavibrio sp.]
MAEAQKNSDLEKISFEDALLELEKIVRELEAGQGDLESSITAYEKGVALKQHCETKLKAAQAKIEKITLNENGTVSAEETSVDG